MRILIMGAGAIGSVAGGLMAEAGHAVTLLGRERHIRAIAERGLRISGIWGEHHVQGLRALTSLDGLRPGDFDLILIAVKSFDTQRASSSRKSGATHFGGF